MEKKIVNTTFYITLIGVITKLIGFVKQTVIANFYGATGQTDWHMPMRFFFPQDL